MLHWVAAAFSDEPSAMLSPALFNGDFSIADWALGCVAHHSKHTVLTLSAQHEYVPQGERGFKQRGGANNSVID